MIPEEIIEVTINLSRWESFEKEVALLKKYGYRYAILKNTNDKAHPSGTFYLVREVQDGDPSNIISKYNGDEAVVNKF
jgi:hypothetical protein